MKVLQINAVFGTGSTGQIVKDVGEMLVANGHEAYYAYQSCDSRPQNGFKVGGLLDEKLHAVWTRLTGRQGYWSRRATRRLIRWIKSVGPDVVHLHNLHSNYVHFNTLTEFLAEANVPTVITMHDCWYFTGKCSHYLPFRCERWTTGCGSCPALSAEVKSWLFDRTKRTVLDRTAHINAIRNVTLVGCSRWIADEARRSLIGGKKIDVAYNGVDTALFMPHESDFRRAHGIGDTEFLVMGMAGKWCDRKNVEGAKSVVRQNPDVKFVIIGEEAKDAFGDCDNVVVVDYISDKRQLADAYSASDVFVNLTRADTLPTVNMEALCSGTPVITFDVGGSPELVREGDGHVVSEGDFDAVSKKIRLEMSAPTRVDVGAAAQRFDRRECYKKYLQIYNYTAGEGK